MISAIILAAGTSSRMKDGNKLLLPLAGKTSVQIVVENVLASGVEEVIVVTGHQASAVRHLLQSFPVKFVHNDNYEGGMTGTIQKGISAARGDGYMICLSDMPFIRPADYLRLRTFFDERRLEDPACIALPRYEGRQGNPVIFSSFYREELLQHSAREGCKKLVQIHRAHVQGFLSESDAVLKDMDTREDYLRALAEGAGGDNNA